MVAQRQFLSGKRIFKRRVTAVLVASATLASSAMYAAADSKFWDATSVAGLAGGDGTWSTSDSFWSTASAGTALVPWVSGDDAFFQTTGSSTSQRYIVTLGGTMVANSINEPTPTNVFNQITLTGGTLQLGAGGLIQGGSSTAALTINSAVTLAATQTWNLGGSTSAPGVIVNGNIGDGGNGFTLVKTGTGVLTFAGTNTFRNLSLSAGVLKVTSTGGLNLPAAGTLTMAGGTLFNTADLSIGSTVSAAAATTSIFNTVTNNVTISGNLTGSGSLATQSSTNTLTGLTLAGADNSGFTGTLTNNKGALVFKSVGAGSAGGTFVINGGDNSASQYGIKLDLGATGIIHFGSLSLPTTFFQINTVTPASGSFTYTMEIGENNASTTIAGNINQATNAPLAIIKAGSGTLTLTSVNSLFNGGVTIAGGTLAVPSLFNAGTNSPIGNSSAAATSLVLDSGTLQYTGAGSTTNHLFTITNKGGTIDSSGAGPLTLSATGSIVSSGTGTRTLTLTGTGSGILTPILANDTGSNATSLTKSGAGSWTISGNNTYTGETRVTAGTLVLNNSATALISSGSNLRVASGAAFTDTFSAGRTLTFSGLAGAGTINAATTGSGFSTAGTIAPGDGTVGALTVGIGSLNVGSGATYNYEIGGTTASPTADLINLTGTSSSVTFGGAWTLNVSNLGTVDPTGKTFVLFQSIGTIAGVGTPAVSLLPAGWVGGTVSLAGGNTQVVLSGILVPEPTSAGISAVAGGMLFLRRRRASRQRV